MTVKDKALEQLIDVNQRQLVDELAAISSLDDNHPIWAIIAMLGAVIGNTNTSAATEVARLRDEVIELKGLVQVSLNRDNPPAQDSAPTLTEIYETLRQVNLVLTDAAHLNRQMPKLLDTLEATFAGTNQRLTAIDGTLKSLVRQ